MMYKCLFILFLFCSFSVFAEDTIERPDLLAEEWSEEWSSLESLESLDYSDSSINESNASLLDYVSIKLKGDLAYSESVTLARGNVRLLSEGAPIQHAYLKADVQFNYFNAKDDLLFDPDDEYSIKINELWAQYSKDACNVKLGRQGLFWGSVEGAQALDIVSPLDLTEPLLTDYSLIRRSQDIISTSCFQNDYDFELIVIPNPLLDQYTVRQTSGFEGLEDAFSAEWGGRITQHAQGLDLSFYYGRFYSNTPKAIIDLNTLSPIGIYVDKFELFGVGIVYAIERLLIEFELSHQKELSFQSKDSTSNYTYLSNKPLKERLEFAIGAEYTTAKNHQFTGGVWFYEYESNPLISYYVDTYILNATWSRQFLNDDLGLSALAFWQKEPELYQITFMANFLLSDYWSTSTAISYQHSDIDEINKNWAIQLSVLYQL